MNMMNVKMIEVEETAAGVFLAFLMTEDEIRNLNGWVSDQPATDLQNATLANLYRLGVHHGLRMAEYLPPAERPDHAWTDATGITWQWDKENFRNVAVDADGLEIEVTSDSRDYDDYREDEFTAHSRGLLDALDACGWKR